MVIDIHVHAFPDKVAAKAIESLESIYGIKAFSDGTVPQLLAQMEGSGVDTSVVLAVSTAARQVVSINDWISGFSQKDNKAEDLPRIIGFGTIHPEFEGYKDEIHRMKELGIKGVKFQPSFQKFHPDDEGVFPIYEELIKAGIIILFHAGDEIKPASHIYSTPERLARMLDAMQRDIDNYGYRAKIDGKPTGTEKIVIAHLGGYKMWDQVEEHLVGRDIFFGTSYVFGHLDTAGALRIMRSHGLDKMLFGSDFPFAQPKEDIQAISELDISKEEKDKIFWKNAAHLLELT
jgi:hypothetical protein